MVQQNLTNILHVRYLLGQRLIDAINSAVMRNLNKKTFRPSSTSKIDMKMEEFYLLFNWAHPDWAHQCRVSPAQLTAFGFLISKEVGRHDGDGYTITNCRHHSVRGIATAIEVSVTLTNLDRCVKRIKTVK